MKESFASRHPGGFTLVELLVTLTVLSLVAVLAFGSVRFAKPVWDNDPQFASTARIEAVAVRIRGLFERAITLPVTQPNFAVHKTFVGSPNHVEFLTIEAHGGLTAWLISSKSHEQSLRLVVHRRAIALPAMLFEIDDWGEPHFEFSGLDAIQFSYGIDDRPDWPPGPTAPALVRMLIAGDSIAIPVSAAIQGST